MAQSLVANSPRIPLATFDRVFYLGGSQSLQKSFKDFIEHVTEKDFSIGGTVVHYHFSCSEPLLSKLIGSNKPDEIFVEKFYLPESQDHSSTKELKEESESKKICYKVITEEAVIRNWMDSSTSFPLLPTRRFILHKSASEDLKIYLDIVSKEDKYLIVGGVHLTSFTGINNLKEYLKELDSQVSNSIIHSVKSKIFCFLDLESSRSSPFIVDHCKFTCSEELEILESLIIDSHMTLEERQKIWKQIKEKLSNQFSGNFFENCTDPWSAIRVNFYLNKVTLIQSLYIRFELTLQEILLRINPILKDSFGLKREFSGIRTDNMTFDMMYSDEDETQSNQNDENAEIKQVEIKNMGVQQIPLELKSTLKEVSIYGTPDLTFFLGYSEL